MPILARLFSLTPASARLALLIVQIIANFETRSEDAVVRQSGEGFHLEQFNREGELPE